MIKKIEGCDELLYSMTDAASIIGFGVRELNKFLESYGFHIKRDKRYVVYDKYITRGYVRVLETTLNNKPIVYTKLTKSGLEYILQVIEDYNKD